MSRRVNLVAGRATESGTIIVLPRA